MQYLAYFADIIIFYQGDMMEKIKKYELPIGILCVVLVILILLQSCSSEHWWFGFTYETNDNRSNSKAKPPVTIVKVNYPSEKVVIPSTIFFHKANALGGYVTGYNLWGAERKGMFEDNDIVKEIVVSEGIEYIFNRCFDHCISLESIQLPSTIKQFSIINCESLKNVNFNGDVKKIESLSFEGCSSLETLVIPDNITIRGIASGAFDGCTSLNSINIPDNIRIIEDYTFSDCTSLKQLFLSRNISHIYSRAFENCTLLEKITIYDKIEYIADNAFEGCDKLTIYGIKGSYAEQYATEHNIPFTEIKE